MAYRNLCVNIIKESRILDRYCLKAAATKRSYSKTASTPSENDEKSTHFGFQTIKESEKTKKGNSSFFVEKALFFIGILVAVD